LKTARVAIGIVALMGAASCGLIAGLKDRSLEEVADAVAMDARPPDAQVADASVADTSAVDAPVTETSVADAQVVDTSVLDALLVDTSADGNETSGPWPPDATQDAQDAGCTPPGQGAACQSDLDCDLCGGQFPKCGSGGCVTMCALPSNGCSSQGDCCIGYACNAVSVCAASCSRNTCSALADCCAGSVCNATGNCVGSCGGVTSSCQNNASCCIGLACSTGAVPTCITCTPPGASCTEGTCCSSLACVADDAGDLVCP
jgi:hypothetical protein